MVRLVRFCRGINRMDGVEMTFFIGLVVGCFVGVLITMTAIAFMTGATK